MCLPPAELGNRKGLTKSDNGGNNQRRGPDKKVPVYVRDLE